MRIAVGRTLRFGRTWATGRAELVEEELTLDRGGRPVPATLLLPARARGPLPGWILMHGITRPGRKHRQLLRLARAVASTGSAAMIPEVPEWLELRLAPALTVPTVEAAVAALRADARVSAGPLGLMGFSFGAPHAIAAAAAPRLHPEIGGVVGFGGYRDLERTIRFMLTGRHEWNGRAHHLRPDPYGRWIVAGNYLAAVPGLEDALDVTAALRRLAAHAGDVGAPAWDAVYDPFKTEVRAGIAPVRRGLFDLIAPPSHQEPPLAEGERMAVALAAAATAVEPQMDPGPALAHVERPVHVLHGRDDHLLPFTEGLRMQQALPATTWSRATVTRLFGHTARDPWPGVLDGIREVALFLRALHDVLAIP